MINLPTVYKKKAPESQGFQHLLSLVKSKEVKLKNSLTLVEKALILRLIGGDQSAFSNIFSAYHKDLVLFAMRYTKDLNNAEEIVQDIFVRLWEDRESVNVNISIKSYLLKSIQNKFIDWYRHNKIKKAHYDFVLADTLKYESDTDGYLLYNELQEQIDSTLSELPEEVSSAFRMNRYKGLKYSEIADLLGVSVRTVEVRIGRALHLLRNHLKDYLPDILVILSLFYINF